MHRLERSGGGRLPGEWLVGSPGTDDGTAFLRARLKSSAFSRHRHDTYTFSVTEQGVQEFGYRGDVHRSLPGQVVILHPDEAHDGRSGTREGFTFRSVYVAPALVAEGVDRLTGHGATLPFARVPVVTDPLLARTLRDASIGTEEPLHKLELLHGLCASLLRHSTTFRKSTRRRGVCDSSLTRARQHIDEHFRRNIGADELETVCGESRFNIAEAFRRRHGTSPYRYLLMRRLDFVRARLVLEPSLADLAVEAGFADQAHMTRHFKATFGLTPAAFRRLSRLERWECCPA